MCLFWWMHLSVLLVNHLKLGKTLLSSALSIPPMLLPHQCPVEVTRELMIRFVRINYEWTELASGEAIACLACCLLVLGKIRFYHTTKSFRISYSEDYALLVGNLLALAFCCRVETGGK